MAERQWDEGTFFKELRRHGGDRACAAAQSLLQLCVQRKYKIEYGKGEKWGTLKPCICHNNMQYVLYEVFTPGFVLLASYLWDEHPFTQDEKRQQLIRRLNGLPLKVPLSERARGDRPRIPLDRFYSSKGVAKLVEVHDWVAEQIRGQG
jgi:hypothetical protein